MKWKAALVVACNLYTHAFAEDEDPVDVDKCDVCGAGVIVMPEPSQEWDYWMVAKHVMDAVGKFGEVSGDPEIMAFTKVAATIFDGTFALNSIGKEEIEPAVWATYELQKSLVVMQQYLLCQFRALLGSYFSSYMDNIALDAFNDGLAQKMEAFNKKCPDRQCLNYSDVSPTQRPVECCEYPYEFDECQTEVRKNFEAVKTGNVSCTLPNDVGICGTNGMCYKCFTFRTEGKWTSDFIDDFINDPRINYEVLKKYKNVDAMTTYHKSTMFIIPIYQQAYLLGHPAQGGIVEAAKKTHEFLEERYEMMMDEANLKSLVDNSSSMSPKSSKCQAANGNGRGTRFHVSNVPWAAVKKSCVGTEHYLVPKEEEGCGNCTAENHCICDLSICPMGGSTWNTWSGDWATQHFANFQCKNMVNTCNNGLKERFEMMKADAVVSLSNETYHLLAPIRDAIKTLKDITHQTLNPKSYGYYLNSSSYPMAVCPLCIIDNVSMCHALESRDYNQTENQTENQPEQMRMYTASVSSLNYKPRGSITRNPTKEEEEEAYRRLTATYQSSYPILSETS